MNASHRSAQPGPCNTLACRAGAATHAPRAHTSHGSRQLPSHPVDPQGRAHNPQFLLPRARFQQQPRMRPSPRRQVGLCDMHPAADAPSPASAPSYQGPGAAEEEYFHAAYLRGVPLPRPALVPVGACPRQERITRCERCRRHVSHPWVPGSEEEIPRGKEWGSRQIPTCPIGCQITLGRRLPRSVGGPNPAAVQGRAASVA